MLENTKKTSQITILERFGNSIRGEIGRLPFMLLRGDNHNMGIAHGFFFAEEIMRSLNESAIPIINRSNANIWESKILPDARRAVFPDKYEVELHSMVEGVQRRLPHKTDRKIPALGREFLVDDLRALNCLIDTHFVENCSSFSARGIFTDNGDVLFGRNLDWKSYPVEKPFMIVAREPSASNCSALVEVSIPGMIGVSTALNESGLVMMAHFEKGLPASTEQSWEPRAPIIRNALELSLADDRIEKIAGFFRNRNVRKGNSTHIVSPKAGSWVLEWDGNPIHNGVTIRSAQDATLQDALFCTNHFLARRFLHLKEPGDSFRRFQRMEYYFQMLQEGASKIDLTGAVKLLDSVVAKGNKVTYYTVIGNLNQKRLFVAVSPGKNIPATEGKWLSFRWEQLFNLV